MDRLDALTRQLEQEYAARGGSEQARAEGNKVR
jgi:hypothetical protein